jgi:hypothetical protein
MMKSRGMPGFTLLAAAMLCWIASVAYTAVTNYKCCDSAYTYSNHSCEKDGDDCSPSSSFWESYSTGSCKTTQWSSDKCDDEDITTNLRIYEFECEKYTPQGGGWDCREKAIGSQVKEDIADCEGSCCPP